MKDFKGAVAVITGGAAGLGLAIAEAAQARGAHLVLADIREDALAETGVRLSRTGEVLTPPASRALPTFAVEVRDGRVLVDPTPSCDHPLIRT